jgi:hypothetical protein
MSIQFFNNLLQEYRPLFENVGLGTQDKTIEDKFFEYEVRKNSKSQVGYFNINFFPPRLN